MKQGRRCSTLLSLVIVLSAVAVVPDVGSGQNNGTDRAVAHVDLQAFSNNQWDVSARSNFNSSQARGSWRFTNANQDPNQVISGEVTCLLVTGNVAFVAGIVTDVKGTPTNANAVFMTMTDSGKFGTTPDLFGAFFTILPPGSEPDCTPFPIFQAPVTDGEIIVQDALT